MSISLRMLVSLAGFRAHGGLLVDLLLIPAIPFGGSPCAGGDDSYPCFLLLVARVSNQLR